MTTLNVNKIKEVLTARLGIEFKQATDISKNAWRYKKGDDEIIINTRKLWLIINGTVMHIFHVNKVKNTGHALYIVYEYLKTFEQKFDIEMIVAKVENTLNFRFDSPRSCFKLFREGNRSVSIDYSDLSWRIRYHHRLDEEIDLEGKEVASATEAIETLIDILVTHFNCFKAQLRQRRIDEIFAD